MSHATPQLSIIVPFHNRMKELQGLLDSLPDAKGVEVLLIDDRSSDPISVQRDFAHTTCVILHTTGKDRFAGAARNIGLRHATGEFVCFCDSDDLVDSTALMDALAFAREGFVDVVYTRPTSFREDGEPGTRTQWYEFLLDGYAKTGDAEPLVRYHVPWSKLIRRSFIKEHGIRFEAVRVSNDVMFNARLCAARPKIALSSSSFYRTREGNPSLTGDGSAIAILERTEVLRRYNDFLKQEGLRRYRIPVVVHLGRIRKSHWRVFLKEMSRSALRREALFTTPYLFGIVIRKKISQLLHTGGRARGQF